MTQKAKKELLKRIKKKEKVTTPHKRCKKKKKNIAEGRRFQAFDLEMVIVIPC